MVCEYEKLDEVEKLHYLAEISNMYYKLNMTQEEIAKQFSVTRFKVSKYLQDARDKGIVEININQPRERLCEIETRLKECFNLKEAIVLDGTSLESEELLYSLGKAGAEYVDSIMTEHSVVGVLWGKTLASLIKNIKPKKKLPITAIQVVGAAAKNNPLIDAPELIRRIAKVYGGNYRYLYAPQYISDDYARKALMREPIINDTLFLANKSDIIITGIGTIKAIFSSALWTRYFEKNLEKYLKDHNAVGCTCGYIYDINGNKLDVEQNKKLIGIDLNTVRHAQYSIGIVTGKLKVEAILGALRGKYINVLVTDDDTATKILSLNETI
jgi:deoxyribonucleoside regulator